MQWHSSEIQSIGRAEIRKAERGNSGEKQGLAWRRKSYDMTGMDKHRDCDERKCIGTAKPRIEKLWCGRAANRYGVAEAREMKCIAELSWRKDLRRGARQRH